MSRYALLSILTPLLALPLVLCSGCEPLDEAPAAVTSSARDDRGWSPCMGPRPAPCGECPQGQVPLWRYRNPTSWWDWSREAACFDRVTGERKGTPRSPWSRANDGNGTRDDNGRDVTGG